MLQLYHNESSDGSSSSDCCSVRCSCIVFFLYSDFHSFHNHHCSLLATKIFRTKIFQMQDFLYPAQEITMGKGGSFETPINTKAVMMQLHISPSQTTFIKHFDIVEVFQLILDKSKMASWQKH